MYPTGPSSASFAVQRSPDTSPVYLPVLGRTSPWSQDVGTSLDLRRLRDLLESSPRTRGALLFESVVEPKLNALGSPPGYVNRERFDTCYSRGDDYF